MAGKNYPVGEVLRLDQLPQFLRISEILIDVAHENGLVIRGFQPLEAFQEDILPLQPGNPAGQHDNLPTGSNVPGLPEGVDPLPAYGVGVEDIAVNTPEDEADDLVTFTVTLGNMFFDRLGNGDDRLPPGHDRAVGVDRIEPVEGGHQHRPILGGQRFPGKIPDPGRHPRAQMEDVHPLLLDQFS